MKFKAVLSIVCAIAAGVASLADDASVKKAQQREAMLRHTGGLVKIKGKGKFGILDLQRRIDVKVCEAEAAALAQTLRVTVEARRGDCGFSVADAARLLADNAFNAAVIVIADEKLPMSLAAVEQHWTAVNVAALAVDSPSPEKLVLRVRKEIQRAATLAYGGICSQYKSSPMQNISTAADLDKVIGEVMTFDAVGAIHKNMEKLGVTQSRLTTYKKACEEGWAQPPTNDYQTAIWNQVKADKERGPSKPLTIAPPAKK